MNDHQHLYSKESIFTRRSTYALLILAALGAAVFLTLKLAGQRQEIRQKAEANTSVSLVPSSTSVGVNQDFTVDVNINTGTNQVSGAEFVINYDENKLQGVSVDQTGSFLPNNFGVTPTITNGVVTFTAAADVGNAKTGQGKVATLHFKSLTTTGQADITFDTTGTLVAAIDDPGHDVAGSKIGTNVIIVQTQGVVPDTVLSVSPQTITIQPGEEVTLNLDIDTGANNISAIQGSLSFNAAILQAVEILPGSVFPNELDTPAYTSGKVTFAYLASLGQSFNGGGTWATLKVKGLAGGTSTVVVDSSTNLVDSSAGSVSMLKTSNPGTVTVAGAAASPGASASPGSSPQASASPLPSASDNGTGGTNVVQASPPSTPPPITNCFNTKPSAPTNVSAISGVDRGTITINWDRQSSTTYYRLNYGRYSRSARSYEYGADNVGDVAQYTIRGLQPGTRYYVEVYSQNGCYPSDPSDEVYAVATGGSLNTGAGTTGGYATPYNTPVVYAPASPDGGLGQRYDQYGNLIDESTNPDLGTSLPSEIPSPSEVPTSGFSLMSFFTGGSPVLNLLKIILLIGSILAILFLIYSKLKQDDDDKQQPGV